MPLMGKLNASNSTAYTHRLKDYEALAISMISPLAYRKCAKYYPSRFTLEIFMNVKIAPLR